MQSQGTELGHTPKRRRITKTIGLIVLAVGIFWFGIGVGSGSVTFGSRAATKENAGLPADLDYTSVERLYDVIKENYDGKLDAQKLLDGIKAGLAESTGDPYTAYLNTKQAKEFQEQLNGTFSGIGAELGQDEQGNLIIVSPIEGFPASKAGLRPQDIIVSVDGKSAAGMSIDEAVSKIRGPKDTKVTLKVLRDKAEDLSFTITRADIIIPSVKSEIVEGGIGYLQISHFGDDTAELADAAARDFKEKGVQTVLLDLRGNPGGVLDGAIDVASLWLPKGKTILQQKRGDVVVSTEVSSGNDILAGVPTVVLINEGSASASEIVAGALKDNKVATLYGVKSYGKGSVQEIHPLVSGSEVKVTIARWYRPNGQNIDKKGISPDKEIKMSDEDFKAKRDPQKDAALQFLKER